jgi:hypothetical protein
MSQSAASTEFGDMPSSSNNSNSGNSNDSQAGGYTGNAYDSMSDSEAAHGSNVPIPIIITPPANPTSTKPTDMERRFPGFIITNPLRGKESYPASARSHTSIYSPGIAAPVNVYQPSVNNNGTTRTYGYVRPNAGQTTTTTTTITPQQ